MKSRPFCEVAAAEPFRLGNQEHCAGLPLGIALQRLAEDTRAPEIINDLSYGSSTAFIAMFRKVTDTTPTRYLNDSRQDISIRTKYRRTLVRRP